ncbi:hypothetical protein DM860_013230 [Cuscuta australis]|uniref:Uncharacterized protein n=1 Tax=Cuscuta australis TaxID=267555 RepID=A0A328DNL4_9ASTE|nr:hypothetical protein DM860_013230 [Cuscuta australis]
MEIREPKRDLGFPIAGTLAPNSVSGEVTRFCGRELILIAGTLAQKTLAQSEWLTGAHMKMGSHKSGDRLSQGDVLLMDPDQYSKFCEEEDGNRW